jgi:hypothetical protein
MAVRGPNFPVRFVALLGFISGSHLNIYWMQNQDRPVVVVPPALSTPTNLKSDRKLPDQM